MPHCHECLNILSLGMSHRLHQRSKLAADAKILPHRMNSIDYWCTIGIPSSNYALKLNVKSYNKNMYISQYISIYHIPRCQLTYFHVATSANQKYRMFPRKSDRQNKIVHLAYELHTIHWQLSATIHTLANQRPRRTIPKDQSPQPTMLTIQFQRESTIIPSFLWYLFLWIQNRMMFQALRMKLFIVVYRSENVHFL